MKNIPKKRVPQVDQNIQLIIKISTFINLEFLPKVHETKQIPFLEAMQTAAGNSVDKLEYLFSFKLTKQNKDMLGQFLIANETTLEQEDLMVPFMQIIQKSIADLKRLDL